MTSSNSETIIHNVWNGVYSTWNDACKAAQSQGGGAFNTGIWLKRITQQLVDYREEYRQFGIALPPRPCNLPLVCAMTSPRVIIDFGGSSGWTWDYLKKALPRHAVSSYVIVELDSVASYMQASSLHSDVVEYSPLEAPLPQCDLLYSNSVLQYFESNAPLLSLVNRTNPTYVLLDDVIAVEGEDFYSMQPYYNTAIPYRFIGLERLVKDMVLLGYREIARFPYLSPIRGVMSPLHMANFPDKLRVRYTQSILMQRRSE